MRNNIKKNTYGIIGLGRFGTAIAARLAEAGKDVIAVDRDEKAVRSVRDVTEYAYVSDSISKETLSEIGIADCGTVIIGIGEQLDTSILLTLNVVSLGVERVIAKAVSAEHGTVLEKLGAEVVYPERDMALRVANNLISNNVIDSLILSGNVEIAELPAPPSMTGKKISELPLRKKYGLNIIAIERGSETEVEIDPQSTINPGDILILIGKTDKLRSFENTLK